MSKDRIDLLVEETGCDPQMAERILQETSFDVEKAIQAIARLRPIQVFKSRFSIDSPSHLLYGLFMGVVDMSQKTLLKFRCVAGYHPMIYEPSLEMEWFEFEKRLYACRLWEGTLQNVSQELEKLLQDQLSSHVFVSFYESLAAGRLEEVAQLLKKLLGHYFQVHDLKFQVTKQELSLERYRSEAGVSLTHSDLSLPRFGGGDFDLLLRISLEGDAEDGRTSDHLQPGMRVYAQIIDNRDAALYLAKLLGGRNLQGLVPLVVPVESVVKQEDSIRVKVRFARGVSGEAILPSNIKIRLMSASGALVEEIA